MFIWPSQIKVPEAVYSYQGCNDVAYRDGECNFIDVTAASPSFVEGDDVPGNYQIIHFAAHPGKQIQIPRFLVSKRLY